MNIRETTLFKYVIYLYSKLKTTYKSVTILVKKLLPQQYQHSFRILSIEQDENDSYIAIIQLVNKNTVFRMHPEEILASDSMTDSFSQRDIRTLTYLGYLGINSPKYKILAQRLSENDNKLIFSIQERGNKNYIIKSAGEISLDEKLICGLDQKDAHRVGYAIATEQVTEEKKQKQQLQK